MQQQSNRKNENIGEESPLKQQISVKSRINPELLDVPSFDWVPRLFFKFLFFYQDQNHVDHYGSPLFVLEEVFKLPGANLQRVEEMASFAIKKRAKF